MCECFVFWCEMGDSDRSQLQKGIAYKWHTIHVNFILEQMSTQWNRDCQKWHRYPSKCKKFHKLYLKWASYMRKPNSGSS